MVAQHVPDVVGPGDKVGPERSQVQPDQLPLVPRTDLRQHPQRVTHQRGQVPVPGHPARLPHTRGHASPLVRSVTW